MHAAGVLTSVTMNHTLIVEVQQVQCTLLYVQRGASSGMPATLVTEYLICWCRVLLGPRCHVKLSWHFDHTFILRKPTLQGLPKVTDLICNRL